jgi:hypothetical protein
VSAPASRFYKCCLQERVTRPPLKTNFHSGASEEVTHPYKPNKKSSAAGSHRSPTLAAAAPLRQLGACCRGRSASPPLPLVHSPPKSAHALAARSACTLAAASRRRITPPPPHPPSSLVPRRHYFPMPRCHCFPVLRRAATPPTRRQLPCTGSSTRRGGPALVVPRVAVPLAPPRPPSAAAAPLVPLWLRVAGERRGGCGEGGAARSALSQPPSSRRDSARREREGRRGRERRERVAGEGEEGERGATQQERRGSREEGRGSEREKEAGGLSRSRGGARGGANQ